MDIPRIDLTAHGWACKYGSASAGDIAGGQQLRGYYEAQKCMPFLRISCSDDLDLLLLVEEGT